jgi:peptidoglycan/LPS O-acetylase OafA/YrhL
MCNNFNYCAFASPIKMPYVSTKNSTFKPPINMHQKSIVSPISRLLISATTGAGCALAGLLVEIIGAALAWTVFRGVPGVLLATVAGGLVAFLIRRATHWPASSTAAAIGAFIAAYFAISCAEISKPGSLQWAIKGGLYGAVWGVPFAVFLGPLGLLRRDRKADRTP